MGKLEDNSSINHFSHEHPLKLQNFVTQATCLACNKRVSGSLFYTCVSCNFYLHKTCSDLPRTLKHRIDHSHNLVLLSSPAYPEGIFQCNACDSNGSGFSYHCPDCQLDLHVVCASRPLLIDHASHSHKLALCFSPPYDDNQGFSCDICKRPGSNHWLYRCNLCDFDAHMECATGITTSTSRSILQKSPQQTATPTYRTTIAPQRIASQPTINVYYNAPVQSHQMLSKCTSLPAYETHHFTPRPSPQHVQQPYYSHVAPVMGVPQYEQPRRQDSFINNVAGHVAEGLVSNVAENVLQSVFEGLIS